MSHASRWAVTGIAAVAFAAAGCGTESGTDGPAVTGNGATGSTKAVNIAFFGLAGANAYTQFAYKAAQKEADSVDAKLTFFDGKFDGKVQFNQMQDAITSARFDGFIVMPNDQPGLVPVAEQAIAKGIKVAALQFPIGKDPRSEKPQVEGITTSVIEDIVKGAEVTGEGIIKACADRAPCEVGLLWGARTVTWEAAKRPPLLAALKSHPGIKVVAEADGGFLQGTGQKATEDMLQAHSGLDVLATPSGDQMIIGGERALKSAGKKVGAGEGEVALVGYGASTRGVAAVRDGSWTQTYALVPETMARTTVKYLVDALRGKDVPDGINQVSISPVGAVVAPDVLKQHPDFNGEWNG